ncbi:hypothetical protein IG631_15037 [Alternaria alternata]|nr:hypothetical protein IG631_15037 [Alternaria alternata]
MQGTDQRVLPRITPQTADGAFPEMMLEYLLTTLLPSTDKRCLFGVIATPPGQSCHTDCGIRA